MSFGLVVVAVSRVKRFLRVGVTKSTTSPLGWVCVQPMADRSIRSSISIPTIFWLVIFGGKF